MGGPIEMNVDAFWEFCALSKKYGFATFTEI